VVGIQPFCVDVDITLPVEDDFDAAFRVIGHGAGDAGEPGLSAPSTRYAGNAPTGADAMPWSPGCLKARPHCAPSQPTFKSPH
jgi:hypothetical protein